MTSLLTLKISKEWSRLRTIDYAHEIYLDDERLILSKFNQIKPMILKMVDDRSPAAIRSWIGDQAIYFGKQEDIKNRNIWLDLYECFKLLQEKELLQIR